ncbi:hypothetical protein LJR168_002331 [Pseudoxanthomonas sp. LjRoot168]|uniref:hypothetical protein n=1 Tax=unclassified Pseudoxanthomonas TaxID=2645906 RepID=UPI003ECC4E8F
MAIVFIVLAIGLAFAAHRTTDKLVRVSCMVLCLANLAGAATAIYKDDPYAFKLRPNDGEYDPNYRRDSRR